MIVHPQISALLSPRKTHRRSSTPSPDRLVLLCSGNSNPNSNHRFRRDFPSISSIPSASSSGLQNARFFPSASSVTNRRYSAVQPCSSTANVGAVRKTSKLTSNNPNPNYYCPTHQHHRNSQQLTTSSQLLSDTCSSSSYSSALKTSASSPYGFNTTNATNNGGSNSYNNSSSSKSPWHPLIAMLERSGIITSRKLSFDSASAPAISRNTAGHTGSNRISRANDSGGASGSCVISLTEPSPVHRHSSISSVNLSPSNNKAAMAKNVNSAAGNSYQMNRSPSHQRLGPGMTSPPPPPLAPDQRNTSTVPIAGIADQRNPLYEVSNEYMRVAGYVQQFNRLLSVKKSSKSGDDGANSDAEKTDDYHGNLTDDGSGKQTMANGNRMDLTKPRGTVYGRLWKEAPNMKRFKLRKQLLLQRTRACNFCLFFAMAGVILTVFEAELVANKRIDKADFASMLLRSVISFTTLILLGFIVWYHAIEIKICVIDSGAHDWRVAITADRVFQLCVELLVCAVCPFPNTVTIGWIALQEDHRQIKTVPVPLDTLLSIPMFLRFYLICRFMALHSRQFQDAATRSIASLNRVTVNFTFVLKTQMHEHPLMVLCGFTVSFWVVMAWLLTQCERYDEVKEDNNYLNALWFIMITFKSVGYGDLVPNTYCGRVLAITTGIVGAAVSSALIAVIGMKLELSRAEKHVNNFMTDSKLTRLRKDTAAMVLQHTWFIHKYRTIQTTRDEMKLRFHQRKFLAAINEFRKIKWDQRKLAEQGNALVDLAKLQSDMHTMIWTMQQTLDHLSNQMNSLNDHVNNLQELQLLQNVQMINVAPAPQDLYQTQKTEEQQQQELKDDLVKVEEAD